MVNYPGNPENITSSSLYYKWKGITLDPDTMLDMFGVSHFSKIAFDLEDLTVILLGDCGDGEKLYVNGKSYEECLKKYINYYNKHVNEERVKLGRIYSDLINLIPMPDSVNLSLLVTMELDWAAFIKQQIKSNVSVNG